jgi:hypothetical protein
MITEDKDVKPQDVWTLLKVLYGKQLLAATVVVYKETSKGNILETIAFPQMEVKDDLND